MANILNYHAIQTFGNVQIWKQQKAEVEAFGKVLMDCLKKQNLKKLKEAISLSVQKRKIYVIYKFYKFKSLFYKFKSI